MYLDLQCSENVNTKIVPEKLDNIHSLNENINSSVEEPVPDQRSSSEEEKDENEEFILFLFNLFYFFCHYNGVVFGVNYVS